MKKMTTWFCISFGTAFAVVNCTANPLWAQQSRSLLKLTTSQKEAPITIPDSESQKDTSTKSPSQSYDSQAFDTSDLDVETIRELFPNGRERLQKQVALDANGDFKNHGTYQEWTVTGEIVATGRYDHGLRQGPWMKLCRPQESKLFESYPYSKFKAPFQSTAEFSADKMNGVWIISDADNRTISQIFLKDGVRDGVATWFHLNGEVLYQAEYKNGILNGSFIEKSQDLKTVRNENYLDGKRVQVDKEHYPSKVLKSEISYLVTSPALIAQDDWVNSKLAIYDKQGQDVKHGEFKLYFENAQLASKGNYENGKLDGEFETFFANGQKECVGYYLDNMQHGKWTWWHKNGMRAKAASYVEGQTKGEVFAWNESGKRITEPKHIATASHEAPHPATPHSSNSIAR